MANFYAKLKQTIKDCDISYVEPLSYIKHFITRENDNNHSAEKIIVFYKRAQPRVQYKPIKNQVKEETGLLDLTGSPLKDSCRYDSYNESLLNELTEKRSAWNDADEIFHPINLNDAQMYFMTISSTMNEDNTPKCWAICESTDKRIMMLSIQKYKNKIRRGILTFNGTNNFEPIVLSHLQAKHLSYVRRPIGITERTIDSFYFLGQNAMLQVTNSVSDTQTMPNEKNISKIILHQTINIDGFRSKFWIQLGILDSIKETIVSYKESKDQNVLVFHSFSSLGVLSDIKQEIYEVLTQPMAFSVNHEDETNIHKPTSIDKVVECACKRVSSDLTEQLWDILKGCSSYEMLKEAIEYIFTSAAKINVVNMPTNQSRLAHLIRDVTDHLVAIPHLSGSEPLELLLEIGLEKVAKDYEYIFTESKLCSSDNLRVNKESLVKKDNLNIRKSLKTNLNFNDVAAPRRTLMHKVNEYNEQKDIDKVGFQNSQFNLNSIENELSRLGRIHLILEHLIMIKVNLNMEDVFTTFVDELQKPLVPFGILKEMSIDSREIIVTNTKILSKIENIPHRQRIVFKSSNHCKIFRNTFYFSSDLIFPPNVFTAIEDNDTKLTSYFEYQYLEIENV